MKVDFLYRHKKDYSRYNIIFNMLENVELDNQVYLLLPFSKNQFIKNFLKRDRIVNDFFISNFDTYVNDRKKISKKNPRAWWKYFQDWVNFRFSRYLLADTQEHFNYWEEMFGRYSGEKLVFPVLADKKIYFPGKEEIEKNDSEPVNILFFGSFIPLHGIDVILNALYTLEKENINFKAKIIGNGQIFPQMQKLKNELGLKKVEMSGEILSEKELADEIRLSDIVLGIFGDSQKAASVIPNKIYQALATKKAVLTMESKAVREFFDDSQVVFCENSADHLSHAIKQLIGNPEKIKSVAHSGFQSFLSLYDNSRDSLIEFLSRVDNK